MDIDSKVQLTKLIQALFSATQTSERQMFEHQLKQFGKH